MKIPSKWALMLAELHNKVMELQDTFDTLKSDVSCGAIDDEIAKELGIEEGEYETALSDIYEELDYICDKLDSIEADTSELDCEYNDYGY